MKFSVEDIRNIDQKKSANRKPKKVAKKIPHMDSPMTPFTAVPLPRGIPVPPCENAPIIASVEVVEVSSPSPPALAYALPTSHIRSQSPPASLVSLFATRPNPPSSLARAGPSSLGGFV